MYNFLIGIQCICILLIAAEMIFVFFQRTSKEQIIFLLMLSSLLLNTLCYTFEIMTHSTETALAMVKLAYVGKLYMVVFFAFFCILYCRGKISKVVEAILLIVPVGILVFIFTADRHSLYYVFLSYLFLYLVGIIIVLCRRYKIIIDKYQKQIILYFAVAFNIPVIGFIIYLSGITKGYDITAVSYVISSCILLWLISKYDLFGSITLAKEAVIDNIKIGAVIIKENEIIYANQYAESLLDMMNERKEISFFDWVTNNKIVIYDERAYELEIANFDEYNIQNLLGLTIHDITERYFYEKNLEQAVYDKTKEIQFIEKEFIISLANIIEERDDSTGYHVKRTSYIVKLILEALKERNQFKGYLTDQYCLDLINAAPLHDIGKIKVSDLILNKPGKLTDEEFEIIKSHTTEGAKIIESILSKMDSNNYLEIAKEVSLYHHEKWNGKGYPLGLQGEEIPLSARIMSISDVYDALIAKRIYKEGFSVEKAVRIIKEESGVSFDPIIVEAFLSSLDKINEAMQNISNI